MARMNIGGKRVTQDAIEKWKVERGYDKPLWWNGKEEGGDKLTNTIFVERRCSCSRSTSAPPTAGATSATRSARACVASLALAIPTFMLGIFVVIVFSLLLVFFRNTYLEFWGTVLCVVLLSISSCSTSSWGSSSSARLLKLVPISGFVPGPIFRVPRAADRHRHRLAARRRGAVLPHDVPGGDRQGLRAHRALQGAVRDGRAVPPRAAQCMLPILTAPSRAAAFLVPRRAHHGVVLRHSRARQLHDRRDQRAGLRGRALDGVRRLGALHHRHTCTDISYTDRRLRECGSAQVRLSLDRRRALAARRRRGFLRLARAAHADAAPDWRTCCTTRRRCPRRSCSACSSRSRCSIRCISARAWPRARGAAADAPPAYSTRTLSVLDALLSHAIEAREKTYSVPLGHWSFPKESMIVDGQDVRDYPRLQFGGAHLKEPNANGSRTLRALGARARRLGHARRHRACGRQRLRARPWHGGLRASLSPILAATPRFPGARCC